MNESINQSINQSFNRSVNVMYVFYIYVFAYDKLPGVRLSAGGFILN